jgi:predicted nucleotidyltransferase
MIFDEWEKFVGWATLDYFLKGGDAIHANGLARELKISPSTALQYLHFYCKEGILEKKAVGNMSIYSLVANPVSRELKRMHFLSIFYPAFLSAIKESPGIVSAFLYGSHASGDYRAESDIDIIIIATDKGIGRKWISPMERKLKKEVGLEMFTPGEWRSLVKKGDDFAMSVIRNHVVLFGADL